MALERKEKGRRGDRCVGRFCFVVRCRITDRDGSIWRRAYGGGNTACNCRELGLEFPLFFFFFFVSFSKKGERRRSVDGGKEIAIRLSAPLKQIPTEPSESVKKI